MCGTPECHSLIASKSIVEERFRVSLDRLAEVSQVLSKRGEYGTGSSPIRSISKRINLKTSGGGSLVRNVGCPLAGLVTLIIMTTSSGAESGMSRTDLSVQLIGI